MAPSHPKKRKLDNSAKIKPSKKVRKQQRYSSPSPSPSADEFHAMELPDSGADEDASSDPTITPALQPLEETPNHQSSASDSPSDSDNSDFDSSSPPTALNHTTSKTKSKRNDPSAFASSISAILSSKLSTSKRSDPVLARSATAAEANASIANSLLEKKARQKLREDKKEALEKGRVKDVLLGTDLPLDGSEPAEGAVAAMMEEEKRLRKTAQRGVVKLFNAVRQAQVRGEEAAKKAGMRGRKEERVNDMSKKGFLELVAGGGKGANAVKQGIIEEA